MNKTIKTFIDNLHGINLTTEEYEELTRRINARYRPALHKTDVVELVESDLPAEQEYLKHVEDEG